jgi:arylsulfatase A-like enzyme
MFAVGPGKIFSSATEYHSMSSYARDVAPAAVILLAIVGSSQLAGHALAADKTTQPASRPNILWITSEDNGPHLGCYGDAFADTPNLDGLAQRGLTYRFCWSNAPVCAPARTAIISGLYPPSTGAEHMRSMTQLPDGMRMYPQYLREAGYYCTNNSKEDYNLEKPGKVWDDSSPRAHWKNRGEGRPFFAIFNHTVSHESQIRKRPHKAVHDPAKVRVPAYHPDTPEVRQDWAQYYDKLTEMDALAGENLQELAQAGLAEDTIVIYFGDHGAGMPRSKRWPYNSGLHVPLLVYIPDKFAELRTSDYEAGGQTSRLVSFVDLAPTVLSLAGIQPPEHFQGHAFLGKYAAAPQPFIYGFRGRMDERYDLVRSLRDERYIYIRNYMPHKIYGQHVSYMFETPTTQVWKQRFDNHLLQPPQSYFWQTKPPEELYDLRQDPDEVHNLAGSAEHQAVLQRMRMALREHLLAIRDVGFLPEDEIHRRALDSTPYTVGHNPSQYPLKRVLHAADIASSLDPRYVKELRELLGDEDSAVRYWAASGLLMRQAEAVGTARGELQQAMHDDSLSVRVIAAQALAQFGPDEDLPQALGTLIEMANLDHQGSQYVAMLALNALDELDGKAESVKAQIAALPETRPGIQGRTNGYIPRLLEKIQYDLQVPR